MSTLGLSLVRFFLTFVISELALGNDGSKIGDPDVLFSCGLDEYSPYQIDFIRKESRLAARLFGIDKHEVINFDNCKLKHFNTGAGMMVRLYCLNNANPNRDFSIILGETGFTQHFFARFTHVAAPELGVACHATNEYIFDELFRYVE